MCAMPTANDIVAFHEDPAPAGASPWVIEPAHEHIDIAAPDTAWPLVFGSVAERVRGILGSRALDLFHFGSTSVPGLPAKPVIDVDLIVADPANEASWLPDLEGAGFVLTVREPWWYEHRMLRLADPRVNLHVFGPAAAEPWRHRIFRDYLRSNDHDRDLYAEAKRKAANHSNDQREMVMDYNRRKHEVVRAIYARAFAAAGLL